MNQVEELKNFDQWFDKSFWKAFKNKGLPIVIPTTPEGRKELIEEVRSAIASAKYSPSIPEIEISINKGYGVARITPVFTIQDYCVYYFCIKELESVLCYNRTPNTFGGWSLGGSLHKKEENEIECELTDYGRYSFNPEAWAEAFGEFNALLFSQLDKNHYAYVLELDISNFYDSIRLDILERWIREEADCSKGWIISLLFYFLNHWNRRNTGLHPQYVGIPQDALQDCSRILANYYLQKYDKFASILCEKSDAIYFRYADDQMILINDISKVETLLLHLTRRLDKYGLRINQKKVKIWSSEELVEYRCRNVQAIFSKKGDNQNPDLVKKFVDYYLSYKDQEREKSWNNGVPMLNRLLNANLESLPESSFEEIMQHLLSKEYLVTVVYRKLKRINDLNNKRVRPIDFTHLLINLGSSCVHNAFHYQALAFGKETKNKELSDYFEFRINEIDNLMATVDYD